jgi:hypothetical protein
MAMHLAVAHDGDQGKSDCILDWFYRKGGNAEGERELAALFTRNGHVYGVELIDTAIKRH